MDPQQETKEDEAANRQMSDAEATAPSVEQLTPEAIEAKWRETMLPPALRSVAERYGKALYQLSAHITNMNIGLMMIDHAAQNAAMRLEGANARRAATEVRTELAEARRMIAMSHTGLVEGWATLAGWSPEKIQEALNDLARVNALANAAPPPKIVMP